MKKVSQGRHLKFNMSRGNAEDLIEASVVNQVACSARGWVYTS